MDGLKAVPFNSKRVLPRPVKARRASRQTSAQPGIMVGLHFLVLEFDNKPFAQKKRDSAKDSEATIDEPPGGWDAADMPCDEGQGDNTSAGDKAESDDPMVTNRVEKN